MAKKKMGRPPLPKRQLARHLVGLRLNDAQHRALKRAAKAEGTTMSGFILACLRDHLGDEV